MTWAPLLLADPSLCLRRLVLRDLFRLPDDHPERVELEALCPTDPLVAELLGLQEPQGSWKPGVLAVGAATGNRILATAFALARFGYLGFDRVTGDERVLQAIRRGADYLFEQQREDGSWSLNAAYEKDEGEEAGLHRAGYSMIPLQTAFPLRGLAACGYATDQRTERAYEWLLGQRLPDGAWPTGVASGVYGYVGGYRRLAHSRWGCRSNTTGALVCLSLHPLRRSGPHARRAVDLLLGRETREQHSLGCEVARLVGAEPARGFLTYFARFDLALLLDLCGRVGVSRSDERLDGLIEFILRLQGRFGLWDYPARPQATRWVTFDIMRSLSRLYDRLDWISFEPRTPFQPYPRKEKRF